MLARLRRSDTANQAVECDLRRLALAPSNPLPCRQQMRCLRAYYTGMETLGDASGPVTCLALAPKWRMPLIVIATSAQGGRDILGLDDDFPIAVPFTTVAAGPVRAQVQLRAIQRDGDPDVHRRASHALTHTDVLSESADRRRDEAPDATSRTKTTRLQQRMDPATRSCQQ